MKTASTLFLILFSVLVLIAFALSIGYIIYTFKATGFITILSIMVAGYFVINARTASRKIA